MPNDTIYIERHPGDLVTAEDWNKLQSEIQADIKQKVDKAKQEVIDGGVKRADNADKFDNKTPKNWTDELDQRYAPKVHDHEGMANYRRYFRRADSAEEGYTLLEHGLGRFPLVDVYQLLDITVPSSISSTNDNQVTKFLLYYGHEELDLLQQNTSTRRLPRRLLGSAWEPILAEYNVQYQDDDSLEDVFNDFLDAFFKLPAADEMAHQVSKWINDHRDNRTIADLKKRGEWDDLRWVVLPQKLLVGGAPILPPSGTAPPPVLNQMDVIHLNYNTTAIKYTGPTTTGTAGSNPVIIDLMILLRS